MRIGAQTYSFRDRSVDENLDLFRRMRAGEFADGARTLRAKIDIASGKVAWEYEDGGAIMSSPAIASGRVVFGSSDGRVVCVG